MIETLKHPDADKKIGIVELCSGCTPDGEEFHAYLSITPSKYDKYIRDCRRGININLQDYGEILHYGRGMQPSEEVKQAMQKKYNIDARLSKTIRAELKKMQEEE